ncbi:MAG: 2-phospho-L-lactate guanylyltransferase [Caldilineaceae bacterium]|nr:2-phospho-L-lactate guanylyltransferase [Caldilineaceae bacterium]
MSLWTILPVKPFGEGKSRLAGHLSPDRRRTLNRNLLAHTLGAVRLAHVKGEIVVVSRDKEALEAAARTGSHALIEEPSDPRLSRNAVLPHAISPELQLNAALTQATRYAVARGATKVLVLPTDIPNLTAEDVRAVASPCGAGPQIIIAPSRDGGTNALFLQPAQAIPFAFGRGSFARHQRLAEAAGIPVRVVASASLLFDIDLPEDYENVVRAC